MLPSLKINIEFDSSLQQSVKLLRFEGEAHVLALAQKTLRQNGLLTNTAQNQSLRGLYSLEHTKLPSLATLSQTKLSPTDLPAAHTQPMNDNTFSTITDNADQACKEILDLLPLWVSVVFRGYAPMPRNVPTVGLPLHSHSREKCDAPVPQDA